MDPGWYDQARQGLTAYGINLPPLNQPQAPAPEDNGPGLIQSGVNAIKGFFSPNPNDANPPFKGKDGKMYRKVIDPKNPSDPNPFVEEVK
jgi:hypothetical protein